MVEVLIGVALLCVPTETHSRSDVEEFVDSILECSTLARHPWIVPVKTRMLEERLYDAGAFPLQPTLQRLFSQHKGIEADANTVFAVVANLLQRAAFIEEACNVADVLWGECQLTPNDDPPHVSKYLQEELVRGYVLSALTGVIKHNESPPVMCRKLASLPMAIKADIYCVEPAAAARHFPTMPFVLEKSVIRVATWDELCHAVDEASLWKQQLDGLAGLAIRLAVMRQARDAKVASSWESAGHFVVGGHFVESCDKYGIARDVGGLRRVLRACAETILGLNLSAVHPLRTGPESTKPQRRRQRDGARAMRRDVDYEFHLHYWDTRNGPEFAFVGPHNVMECPE